MSLWSPLCFLRICKPRIAPIVSGSRMRCVCCVCVPWTAWRRRYWLLPNTNWTWTRRSSRPVCSTRNPPAMSAGLSCRPSWSTKSRMRYGHVYHFQCPVNRLCFLLLTFTLLYQEEDEVPDDETVNQMIARSEEEFDHFMVRSATCFHLTFCQLDTLFCSTLLFQFFLILFRPAHGSGPASWRGS